MSLFPSKTTIIVLRGTMGTAVLLRLITFLRNNEAFTLENLEESGPHRYAAFALKDKCRLLAITTGGSSQEELDAGFNWQADFIPDVWVTELSGTESSLYDSFTENSDEFTKYIFLDDDCYKHSSMTSEEVNDEIYERLLLLLSEQLPASGLQP